MTAIRASIDGDGSSLTAGARDASEGPHHADRGFPSYSGSIGRSVTAYPKPKTDIENAGGRWSDREFVVEKWLLNSRNTRDLPAFCAKMVEEFAASRQPTKARSTT